MELQPKFRTGDRVLMIRHSDWKADASATIIREGRPRDIYDGSIHIEYVIEFDDRQTDSTDESAGRFIEYNGTTVIEDYLVPLHGDRA